ncbi:MAG: hypothetical protein WAK20_09575, partial [Candidatus Acidiferrum sp.]
KRRYRLSVDGHYFIRRLAGLISSSQDLLRLSLVVTSKPLQFGQMPFALRASGAVLRRPNTTVG